MLLVLILLLYY